jgi:hypothetical protein
MRDCNWVQGLEGDIDTSHLAFLHLGAVRPETARPGSMDYYTVKDRSPRYIVLDTEFGTSYGAYRPAEEDTTYWRVAHFLFPFYTMIPTGVLGDQIFVRAWVPLDDYNMMAWNMGTIGTDSRGGRPGRSNPTQVSNNNDPSNTFFGAGFLPDTSDWLGKFRIIQNMGNDYLIDREAQRNNKKYTGIPGINEEDQAVTESMGAIANRPEEHLGSSDAMSIRSRVRLMNAAKALRENGTIPPGVDNPEIYRYRSGGVILPRNLDWFEGTKELRKAFVEHKPEDLYAPVIKS